MIEWVRARLQLVATSAGGRSGPIRTGYRPNWDFGERVGELPNYWMGQVHLLDREWLQPGESADVRVCVVGERWQHVRVGDIVDVREGRKLVGRATLTVIEDGDQAGAP